MDHPHVPNGEKNNIFKQSEIPAVTETILHSVSESVKSKNPVSTKQSVLPSARGSSQATTQQDSTLATTEASEYFNNTIHMWSSSNNSTEQNRDSFIMQALENLKRQTSSLQLKVDSVLNQQVSSLSPADQYSPRVGPTSTWWTCQSILGQIVCAASRVTQVWKPQTACSQPPPTLAQHGLLPD